MIRLFLVMLSLTRFQSFFTITLKSLFGIWVLHWLAISLFNTSLVTRLLDMNAEKNIPTLFSCAVIAGAMMSLFAIATFFKTQAKSKLNLYWSALAWVFALLCLDEWFSLHDTLGGQFAKLFIEDISHPWLVTYSVLCVIGALICIPFFKHLPKQTAALFIGSGAIYILGAMGFEFLNSFFHSPSILNLIYFIEEGLEMLGMLLFWWALLDFIKTNTTIKQIPFHKKTILFFTIVLILDTIASQIAFAS